MFTSRGFKCKISLVNTTQENIVKGGYEQKETVSIPYRYFKERAQYAQEQLKIPPLNTNTSGFVDFFKGIPIYMKKKYDEYKNKKTEGSQSAINNSVEEGNQTIPSFPNTIDSLQNNTPQSEPIEKLKEENSVNIENITKTHPIQLANEEHVILEENEKKTVLEQMQVLDFLKIELEDFENITIKKKSYNDLVMIKDFINYLIENKKEVELKNEKTIIVKSEKAIVVIGELIELNIENNKMKEYFEEEKIKGTPLSKELLIM
jgi:hypothetical protein